MIQRIAVVAVALLLFLIEPNFAFLSPLTFDQTLYYFVPRFLVVFLIFLATYQSKKRAMYIGLFFGILYDIFYVDIIGLYAFLYPGAIFLASTIMGYIKPNMMVTATIALVIVTLLETAIYGFYSFISITDMPWQLFVQERLLPTLAMNFLFIILTAIIFVYLINAKLVRNEMNTV
ncbi:MAG TPA: rod shape-determining protein MreD [Metalysinibacillus jejuensis]|uniref:Rod shape-determining protein MreD n=1 Tax=Metalysinibacillus jejuensis TaxID=914327 RepID=A0A921NBX1_9BACL|nr:rod shape-determining protein MreD [Metalysinibacillus jejuensis]